jgi:DNA-nicking Smr family endonuclease
MEPIEMPIEDVLDLHTFLPKEIPDLLEDYLSACQEEGLLEVRIIHGKGKGIQKARVVSLLKKNPLVKSLRPAGEDAGGWGATLVTLHRPSNHDRP